METSEPAAGGEVTLFVARSVDRGHEEDFERWARGILGAAAAHPGNLGTGLLRPSAPGEPWHLLLHFRDAEAFKAWQESPERAACFARATGHHVEVRRRELHGMEGWFATTPTGAHRTPPPRWKMAVASTVAIAPLTVSASLWLNPHLVMPAAVRSLVLAPVISTLMTYVALPAVTRAMRRWLFPRRGADAELS
ncbi:antibiotic biosynthesis monooxygenase [Kitasatospora sp. NPDC048365]|uniref:antibiotic biosynthesis monooxygenase n=1 Tax=Kitasatospora sp. NPDC048365 TaxID=3364050 RepID=UPI003719638E